jgi:hypothetical protein
VANPFVSIQRHVSENNSECPKPSKAITIEMFNYETFSWAICMCFSKSLYSSFVCSIVIKQFYHAVILFGKLVKMTMFHYITTSSFYVLNFDRTVVYESEWLHTKCENFELYVLTWDEWKHVMCIFVYLHAAQILTYGMLFGYCPLLTNESVSSSESEFITCNSACKLNIKWCLIKNMLSMWYIAIISAYSWVM